MQELQDGGPMPEGIYIKLTNKISKKQFLIDIGSHSNLYERLFHFTLIEPFFNGAFTGGEMYQKAIKINAPGIKGKFPDYWVVLPGGKHIITLQIQDKNVKHFTEEDKQSNYIIATATGCKVASLFISLSDFFESSGRVRLDILDELFSYIIERILYFNDNYQDIQYDGNVHLECIGYDKQDAYYPQRMYRINNFLGLKRNILNLSKITRERVSYGQLTLREYNIFKDFSKSSPPTNSTNYESY
eukprot:UN09704